MKGKVNLNAKEFEDLNEKEANDPILKPKPICKYVQTYLHTFSHVLQTQTVRFLEG